MRGIHSIICNLQDNFHQSDTQIALILSQGVLAMKKLNEKLNEVGLCDGTLAETLQNIDDYLDDELWGELDE